jgi:hypothetical protein
MEIRNIVILYNDSEVTKEQITADLKGEGYTHNFMFANPTTKESTLERHLHTIDEVWLFKDCSHMWQYKFFTDKGCDIWQMS